MNKDFQEPICFDIGINGYKCNEDCPVFKRGECGNADEIRYRSLKNKSESATFVIAIFITIALFIMEALPYIVSFAFGFFVGWLLV